MFQFRAPQWFITKVIDTSWLIQFQLGALPVNDNFDEIIQINYFNTEINYEIINETSHFHKLQIQKWFQRQNFLK